MAVDDKKDMLLVAVNARYSHSNLAVRYLREYCSDLQYDFKIREFTIQQNADDIVGEILREGAGAVAFSVYIWNSGLLRDTVSLLRDRAPGCRIVLGGPEVSYNAERWLREVPADYIVAGRGEEGFRQLLERGVSWDSPVVTVPAPHFSQIPIPYRGDDFVSLSNRYVYYESSRGCPFHCSYCLSSAADQNLEMKDCGRVMEELSFIMKHSPGTIKFVDRTFNAHRERARKLWQFIMERFGGAGTVFHFEIHPALLEEEDFRVLSRAPAGLFRLEIGLQSTNDDTLREIGRRQSWTEVREGVRRLISMKLFHVHVDLIAGLPCEDMQSMETSFNDAWGLRPQYLQLGFLKILPGTEIAARTGSYGIAFDGTPPYRVRENNWLSRGDMETLERISRLVNALYNSGGFHVTLKELERLQGSPFRIFLSLAGRAGERDLGRDWERGARLILSYVRDHFPDQGSFITDCLRWDWCLRRAPRRYPLFLRLDEIHRMKRDFYQHLRSGGNAGGRCSLKGRLVFVPETGLFRERYLGEGTAALFGGRGMEVIHE
ncbi:MAG: DUF4080 domain-containing protein [Spirochaetes bacterium]|nr:DUF4080 domain-containing protein [Spirochaetota bacterium]